MSITTSQRLNGDQVAAGLPTGAGFSSDGADLDSSGSKTLTGIGCTDAQLQSAVTSAAAAFVDRDANQATLTSRAQTALTNNATFLAINNPTTAQAVTQVKALTRQVNGLLRFLLNEFDSISDS